MCDAGLLKELWEPWQNDFEAELAADLAYAMLDTGIDGLRKAIASSRRGEYLEWESGKPEITDAWRRLMMAERNISHEIALALRAFKTIRDAIPDDVMEEHGRE